MTELIVALDGPGAYDLMQKLREEAGVKWFKIGPQAITYYYWAKLIWQHDECRLFLDLKLADTRDTVTETIKRLANVGIDAVSTFTDEATRAALDAGTGVYVWQIINLTDSVKLPPERKITNGAICPGHFIEACKKEGYVDIVVPGVRFADEEPNGHMRTVNPVRCRELGATHVVVGRPIWNSPDPVLAARRYAEALA